MHTCLHLNTCDVLSKHSNKKLHSLCCVGLRDIFLAPLSVRIATFFCKTARFHLRISSKEVTSSSISSYSFQEAPPNVGAVSGHSYKRETSPEVIHKGTSELCTLRMSSSSATVGGQCEGMFFESSGLLSVTAP